MKKLNNYLAIGVVAFLVIAASIVTGFLIFNISKVVGVFKAAITVLEPFIIGFIIAYLIAPLYNLIRGTIRTYLIEEKKMEFTKAQKKSKGISLTISMIVALLVLTGLVALILPGFIDSIIKIVNSMNIYMKEIVTWLSKIFADSPEIVSVLESYLNEGSAQFVKWLTESILPQLKNISDSTWSSVGNAMGNIFSLIIVALNVAKNFIIGFIVAAYLLASKTLMIAQCKKVIYALFKTHTANSIMNEVRYINHVFGGFIRGKIIDSAIIGAICFVFCAIVSMPYTLLVSVIIGVTNIIPFFGPFIGAVPCTLLVLLVSPKMALVFVIFVVILQQIDGNIIGPKILGDSTGMSAFWVLFAILVFGQIFGIAGMIIGVPVWAVISSLFDRYVVKKLAKKELSNDIDDYIHLDVVVENEDGTFDYPKEKRKKHYRFKQKS